MRWKKAFDPMHFHVKTMTPLQGWRIPMRQVHPSWRHILRLMVCFFERSYRPITKLIYLDVISDQRCREWKKNGLWEKVSHSDYAGWLIEENIDTNNMNSKIVQKLYNEFRSCVWNIREKVWYFWLNLNRQNIQQHRKNFSPVKCGSPTFDWTEFKITIQSN